MDTLYQTIQHIYDTDPDAVFFACGVVFIVTVFTANIYEWIKERWK